MEIGTCEDITGIARANHAAIIMLKIINILQDKDCDVIFCTCVYVSAANNFQRCTPQWTHMQCYPLNFDTHIGCE